MRAVVQRVRWARVRVAGRVVGAIEEPGLAVLVGVTHTDTAQVAARLARKVVDLRILRDPRSASAREEASALDVGAPVLVVSQFTLYADTTKGRRPSWSAAAAGPRAEPLVAAFAAAVSGLGLTVATGSFGADMQVELVNDGPVTLLLELEAGAS